MAKRSGLGKGLESLMGGADAEVGGAVAPDATLPLSDIRPNKGQPRKNFDEAALEELADSIKQNGVLQPILVRKVGQKYEIVAGERRYQASKRAGLDKIPVGIRDISDQDVFKLALIENLQRSDLDPIEEAQGFKTLIDQSGMTQAELAKASGMDQRVISRVETGETLPTVRTLGKIAQGLGDNLVIAFVPKHQVDEEPFFDEELMEG